MAQRVGLVLAGGLGRRFGRPKADLVVGGRSLARRAAESLWPVCGSVLVSVREGADDPAPGYAVLVDPAPPGRGPLAGIDAAFDATGEADLLVLACDYPGVGTPLLEQLIAGAVQVPEADLVLVTDLAGRDHPLVALWRRSARAAVADAVAAGRLKVRGLLPDLDSLRLGPADFPGFDLALALRNVNEPADLDAFAEGTWQS